MSASFARAAILALSLSLTSITLTACGRSPEQRIADAGTTAGQARATVATVLPKICGERVPDVGLRPGMELSTHDGLEGRQLDAANDRITYCYRTGNALLAAVQVVGKAAN